MTRPATASVLTLAAVPLAISSFFVVVWFPYLIALGKVGKSLEQHIAEEGALFRDGLHMGLSAGVAPTHVIGYSGLLGWGVLAVGVLVGVWWVRTRSQDEGASRLVYSLVPTLLPLLAGVALAPFHMRASFSALAEAGLSNPGLVGIGVGESLSLVALGGYLTVGLAVLILISNRKRVGPQEAPSG